MNQPKHILRFVALNDKVCSNTKNIDAYRNIMNADTEIHGRIPDHVKHYLIKRN